MGGLWDLDLGFVGLDTILMSPRGSQDPPGFVEGVA